MERWLGVGLLLAGTAGALRWAGKWRAPLLPLSAAVADVVLGVIGLSGAGHVLRALLAPVGFLLCAVPMSVMLDRLGLFEALAKRVPGGGSAGAGYLWVLGALVTTFLNLDASVVLLTPLYVRIARRRGLDAVGLGAQPVLLACLASSALPVSNLTNLIAASWTGAGTAQFVAHLGAPSLVAAAVGWWAYRRAGLPGTGLPGTGLSGTGLSGTGLPGTGQASEPGLPTPTGSDAIHGVHRKEVLLAGAVVSLVLVGFTFGYLAGVEPWEVALAADVVLVAALARSRERPVKLHWGEVPVETAATVLSLGVLAAAVARHVPVASFLAGHNVGDLARDSAVAAASANAFNNLPTLLVALGALGHGTGSDLWAVMAGVNMGPVLLVTGSLASLLWLTTMRRLGVDVRARDFTRLGLRVGLPAAAAGLATLVVIAALGGPA